jgi:hypothetical protein
LHFPYACVGVAETYHVRARHPSGVYSLESATISVTAEAPEDGATLGSLTDLGSSVQGTPSGTVYEASADIPGLVLSPYYLNGTYITKELDLTTDAVRWWTWAVDTTELNPGRKLADLTWPLRSGEGVWNSLQTRPGSDYAQGANFDITLDELTGQTFADIGLWGQGNDTTRVKVEMRFYSYETETWTSWKQIQGGRIKAGKAQIRLTLDRIDENYQAHVQQVDLVATQLERGALLLE